MKSEDFTLKRLELLNELEQQFIKEIPEDIDLSNYKEYDNFYLSQESKKVLKDKVIENSTEWKIGDRFVKVETIFYPSSQRVETSVVWKITDIHIFYNKTKSYYLSFYCKEADVKHFHKKTYFDDLKSVYTDKVNYYFVKIGDVSNMMSDVINNDIIQELKTGIKLGNTL